MTFFEAHDSEAVRPMLDVSWAPLLGAFSVLFEEHDDEYFVGLCLEGFIRYVVVVVVMYVGGVEGCGGREMIGLEGPTARLGQSAGRPAGIGPSGMAPHPAIPSALLL